MADASATSMLVSLLPVVVGGVIGFASSLGGQWFIHGLQAKAEKQRRRAAKFEEVIAAIYEFDHWLDTLSSYRVFGGEQPKTMSPLPKVRAICSLHFPQYKGRMLKLVLAAGGYEKWMFEAAQKRIQTGKPTTDGHKEVYEKYLSCRHELIKALEEFAQRELQ